VTGGCFICVDAGTTRLKAALLDGNGGQLDIAGQQLQVLHPFDGACESDMLSFYRVFCSTIKELYDRNKERWNILGLGITGQGDGFWAVNKQGEPVRNAILWNDTRVKNMNFSDLDNINDYCINHSVTSLFSGAAPLLAKWVKEKEPQNYSRVYKILHCKDWLNYKLTGNFATDYSDASTAVFNIFKKSYSTEVLGMLGIPESLNLFPMAYPSSKIVGLVNERASFDTCLAKGTPVICGAIDVTAAALGIGLKKTGQACTIVGTTLCNEILLDEKDAKNPCVSGSVLDFVSKDKYLRIMAALSGASTLDWARSIIVPELPFDELEECMKKIPCGCEGVIYLPYIYGERSPFKNPLACGGFYGLTERHSRFHLIRAAYEGLALSMYDCYMNLPQVFDKVYISGGGAQSSFICQLFSDCLGKPMVRKKIYEPGIQGIYYLLREAFDMGIEASGCPDSEVFMPDNTNHMVYIRLYKLFKELRGNMKGYWKERAEFIKFPIGEE